MDIFHTRHYNNYYIHHQLHPLHFATIYKIIINVLEIFSNDQVHFMSYFKQNKDYY